MQLYVIFLPSLILLMKHYKPCLNRAVGFVFSSMGLYKQGVFLHSVFFLLDNFILIRSLSCCLWSSMWSWSFFADLLLTSFTNFFSISSWLFLNFPSWALLSSFFFLFYFLLLGIILKTDAQGLQIIKFRRLFHSSD